MQPRVGAASRARLLAPVAVLMLPRLAAAAAALAGDAAKPAAALPGSFAGGLQAPDADPVSGAPASLRNHIRPSAGGPPDVVGFGIYVKAFGSSALREGTWSADFVLTLEWVDNRTWALIPTGEDHVTLSEARAQSRLWLPEVVVENRKQGESDTLSSVVRIERGGVRKVDRVRATMRKSFDARYYPFDKQVLQISLGSSTFMAGQLVFRPLDGAGVLGYAANAFNNSTEFAATGWDAYVVEETTGLLRKSRGRLDISVERRPAKLLQFLFLPEVIIVVIGYTTLWYPTLAVFVMPRVATAIVAFLTFMNLSIKCHNVVPATENPIWVDNFEGACGSMLFFIIVANLLVILMVHEFDLPNLGLMLQWVCRGVVFLLFVLTLVISGLESYGDQSAYFGTVSMISAQIAAVAVVAYGMYRLTAAKRPGAAIGP